MFRYNLEVLLGKIVDNVLVCLQRSEVPEFNGLRSGGTVYAKYVKDSLSFDVVSGNHIFGLFVIMFKILDNLLL